MIYQEAKRRYTGGAFTFPDCPECGAHHTAVVLMRQPDGTRWECDKCKHRWPYLDDRDLAEGLLAMVEYLANELGEEEGCPPYLLISDAEESCTTQ